MFEDKHIEYILIEKEHVQNIARIIISDRKGRERWEDVARNFQLPETDIAELRSFQHKPEQQMENVIKKIRNRYKNLVYFNQLTQALLNEGCREAAVAIGQYCSTVRNDSIAAGKSIHVRQTVSPVLEFQKMVAYLSKPIGTGATGTVYEGSYEVESNKVAIKVVQHELLDQIKWKELEVLRKVVDPNIVRYFATESLENVNAIAMELANSDLEEWLKSYEIKTKPTIKKIIKDASKGLAALHSLNPVIIHRDIKPSNVLLFFGKEIVAKLSDFGISRIAEPSRTAVTTTQPGIGTKNWIPPEALLADSAEKFTLETTFDIFPLGVLVHYVISDRKHLFSSTEADTDIVINLNVVRNKPNWKYESKYFNKVEYEGFVKCLTKPLPSARPSIQSILQHPIFWDYKKGLNFIKAVSMDLDKTNEVGSGPIRSELDQLFAKEWNKQPWDERLCQDVRDYKMSVETNPTKQTKTPKKYNTSLCMELLEFISDKERHFGSWKKHKNLTLPHVFGNNGCNYAEYFIERFPELIPNLFELFQNKKYSQFRSKQLSPFFLKVKTNSFNVK